MTNKKGRQEGKTRGISRFRVGVLFGILIQSLLIVSVALAQELDWARQDGGPGSDTVAGIAIDKHGNSYVTGDFYNSITFGAGEENKTTLTPEGQQDLYVASYRSDGVFRWARKDGVSGILNACDIAVEKDGNSYVTGTFSGEITFGVGEDTETTFGSIGSRGIFVASYDKDGGFLWAAHADGSSNSQYYGIAVDSSGNSYITGPFKNTLTFGTGDHEIILNSYGSTDIYRAAFNQDGDLLWAYQDSGESWEEGVDIAVDRDGNSYIIGVFDSTVTFGINGPKQEIRTSSINGEIFIAKYDTDGGLLWVEQAGGSSSILGVAIDLDSENNVYVTGDYEYKAIFDAGGPNEFSLPFASLHQAFVASYTSNGNFRWATRVGGFTSTGTGITISEVGDNYVAGIFQEVAIFGEGEDREKTIESFGYLDIFIAVYDKHGLFLGVQQDGGLSEDFVAGITVDKFENSYATGTFRGEATFGQGTANEFTFTASGWNDIFLTKYQWRLHQERIEAIIDDLLLLIEDGELTPGQGHALIAQLEAAVQSLDQQNYEAAVGQLSAFINAIEAAVQSGKLDPVLGQSLISDVQSIINSLEV